MSTNKTQPTSQSVDTYLASIEDEQRRSDAQELLKLLEEVTSTKPIMWGTSIVGFGTHHYVYESGRSGDTPAVGFSARKQALTVYGLFYEPSDKVIAEAGKLGPHTSGKGCLYIKKLSDINLDVLKRMSIDAYKHRANS